MLRREHVAFYHTQRREPQSEKIRSSGLGCARCYVFPKQANGDGGWEFRTVAFTGECVWRLTLLGMEMTCLLGLGKAMKFDTSSMILSLS